MGNTIIMYQTALFAEKLMNQLHKTHLEYAICKNIIETFNKGIQLKTDSEYIYSLILNGETNSE